MNVSSLPPPPPGKSGWPWREAAPALAPTRSDGSPWPRISIVTPSYNQGPFIEETIRSVLLQGYPNLEYWVIDGGSTDNTVEIVEKYAPWLAGWISERDRGQTDALNKGWARCTGEWLAWLNSDDLYTPGALAALAEFAAQNPQVDVAYGTCDLIDEQSRFIARAVPPAWDFGQELSENFISQPSTFMRRAVVEALGGVNEARHFAFDYELWLRAALHGFRFAPVPGPPLAAFRLWEVSKTESSAEKFVEESLDILEEVFANPRLPAELREIRPRALSGAWRAAAFGCYRAGRMEAARRCLREMAALDPSRRADPAVLSLWARSFLGSRPNAAARRLKRALSRARHASTTNNG